MGTTPLEDIDLIDGRNFVAGVPHHWFRQLRQEAPVYWHLDPTAPRGGFWTVTGYEDCVTVNRDWEHFSSARKSALFTEMDADALAQQQLMMLNMDPTMHTRYRRLVNHGFTPKLVRDLEQQIVGYADGIIDAVCERGTADFVEEISAELPLLVIAELLGVPQEDRRMVFEWSNRMIGSEDPEYQLEGVDPGESAMQVFSYAEELAASRRLEPRQDLVSVLLAGEVEGEKLDQIELDLFFLLLIVAGNETTRNLMSGAMTAFFDHPDQWELLRQDRSLLAPAVEEMLRYVTPVMHFRRTATMDQELGGQPIQEGDKVVFWHTSANRDERVFSDPDVFDVTRQPNNHIAFGGGGPHFCLGANLARMEIMVMFDRLLDRIPDIRLDGEVQRLQSNFINGTKHIPVAFAPSAPVGGTPLPPREPLNGVTEPPENGPGVTEQRIRFHQSITFLPTRQAVPLARASEEAGYGGIYISDHLFNPRALASRYTYSLRPDGAPGWEPETPWPDPMCVVSALASVTEAMTFTTGVYIAPVRDLITVAKSVGTAAVLSDNRVRLGVGVGWCKEEFDQTGQDFASRGGRLTEMIDTLRALWHDGWVEFHGDYYDVPACMMEPAPSAPVPILGGGHSPVALRRTAAQCDGWIAAGAYSEAEAWTHLASLRAALSAAGREGEPFAIYMSLNERPDVDMYRRFVDAGVTDFVCAPWMFIRVEPGTPDDKALADRLGAVRWFADEFVAKV